MQAAHHIQLTTIVGITQSAGTNNVRQVCVGPRSEDQVYLTADT